MKLFKVLLEKGIVKEGIFRQTGANNKVSITRTAKPVGWAGNTSSYASQLNSTNKIGPNQLLKVMPARLKPFWRGG